MMKVFSTFLLMTVLVSLPCYALDVDGVFKEWLLKDVEIDQQGYYQNTGSDGFISLTNLNLTRAEVCGLSFDMEFKEPPLTPVLMEIYWRGDKRGFSAGQKGLFIVNETLEETAHQFVVPLCKLYKFSGGLNKPPHQENINAIRIDYPSNRTIAIKIHNLDFLDAEKTFASTLPVFEPYERISATEFASLDVMLPKFFFIIEHGLTRLGKDKVFLVFWLLLIFGLVVLLIKSIFNKRIN